MTLTCISVYCENRRLSTATNTAMPAIRPKQTEQNASLDFIMETDFDLFDFDFEEEAKKKA